MHHPQIARRVFNTPLLVEPARAAAFLTGLGPRITGQEIAFAAQDIDKADDKQMVTTLPGMVHPDSGHRQVA